MQGAGAGAGPFLSFGSTPGAFSQVSCREIKYCVQSRIKKPRSQFDSHISQLTRQRDGTMHCRFCRFVGIRAVIWA